MYENYYKRIQKERKIENYRWNFQNNLFILGFIIWFNSFIEEILLILIIQMQNEISATRHFDIMNQRVLMSLFKTQMFWYMCCFFFLIFNFTSVHIPKNKLKIQCHREMLVSKNFVWRHISLAHAVKLKSKQTNKKQLHNYDDTWCTLFQF